MYREPNRPQNSRDFSTYGESFPNFDSSEFDSTGVKLYIFIHNEVRDFDKNSTQPEIRVNRIRDNESQLYNMEPIWLGADLTGADSEVQHYFFLKMSIISFVS
jgi:hypothetical protein